MKYLLPLILVSFAAFLPASQAQSVRRLLLFAGDGADMDLKTQREWLQADSLGVEERDIWIAVFTDPKTFRRMYEHHGANRHAFSLVLMGKDGAEIFRSEKPVATKELFELIDAIPVRQVEIGEGSKSNQNDE